VVCWTAGTVTIIEEEPASQALQNVAVVVIWKVIVDADAVAGIVWVTSVVFVVKPDGHTSTYEVRITVVITSSPELTAGTDTIGTCVVETATGLGVVTTGMAEVEGTALISDVWGTVTAIVVGLGPQPVHTVLVMVIWNVMEEVKVAGMVLVISAVLVVRPDGHTSTNVVRITVVVASSPDDGVGAETTGTEVTTAEITGVV